MVIALGPSPIVKSSVKKNPAKSPEPNEISAPCSLANEVVEAVVLYAYPSSLYTPESKIQVFALPVSKSALILYGGFPTYTSAIYEKSPSLSSCKQSFFFPHSLDALHGLILFCEFS